MQLDDLSCDEIKELVAEMDGVSFRSCRVSRHEVVESAALESYVDFDVRLKVTAGGRSYATVFDGYPSVIVADVTQWLRELPRECLGRS